MNRMRTFLILCMLAGSWQLVDVAPIEAVEKSDERPGGLEKHAFQKHAFQKHAFQKHGAPRQKSDANGCVST